MTKLTPAEATKRMKALDDPSDPEHAHYEADVILRRIAREAGFRSAVDAYSKIYKWYA